MLHWLDSLRVQLVLLVIAALVLAQAFSLLLFVDERSLAVRAALGFEAASRAANVARLIEEAPISLQPAILRAANSPLVRFDLSKSPAVDHETHADNGAVEERVRSLLGQSSQREIRVELHEADQGILPMPHMGPEMTQMHQAMMRGKLSAIEMQLSISLTGEQWLNVATRFERPPLQWPWYSFVSFGMTAALILIVACWFLLSRLIRPLLQISQAAERLGRGENVEPLPEMGPSEVRNLTRTYNRMQERLGLFIADRTQLLAALGHDLRSPLTALRIRAEMIDDDETRERVITSVEEMQGMVDETLAFAKGMATAENYEAVDLGAYLACLQSDMLDSFTLEEGEKVTVRIRPQSVRRALRNLIENARRYGETAHVTYHHYAEHAFVAVSDNGPGIPETDLEKVFAPFFRLERSRSRETGGTGLGLSIARTIARAHGGDVSLSNRPAAGLMATMKLPIE